MINFGWSSKASRANGEVLPAQCTIPPRGTDTAIDAACDASEHTVGACTASTADSPARFQFDDLAAFLDVAGEQLACLWPDRPPDASRPGPDAGMTMCRWQPERRPRHLVVESLEVVAVGERRAAAGLLHHLSDVEGCLICGRISVALQRS